MSKKVESLENQLKRTEQVLDQLRRRNGELMDLIMECCPERIDEGHIISAEELDRRVRKARLCTKCGSEFSNAGIMHASRHSKCPACR